jgi:hypothetical protein
MVALGWLWVTFMMAITEKSVIAGIMTFVFYGLLPCGVLLYLLGTGSRRRRAARRETEERMAQQEQQPEAPPEKRPEQG